MRALIVGAGIAGLTTAWWLERIGWEVEVVERAPEFRAGGYMIDFFGPGHEVAERMGMQPELERHRARIESITSVDERGRRRSELGAATYAGVAGGMISLLRGDLASVLRDGVGAPIRFGMTVEAVERMDCRIRVLLTNGTVEEVDLLVGADGVHSRVRELMFGPEEQFVRYLGYHVAAFSGHDGELSRSIGERYQMLTMPNRMIGSYAVGEGGFASFFLYRDEDRRLPDDPATALRSRFGDLGGVVPKLLSALSGDVYFDQAAQVEMDRWHRDRVVLVGDACGAVSLFAGHGASLAMTGVHVLAEELAGGDVSEALVRYQERMRPPVIRTQEFGRRFTEWMAPSSRWRILLRDWMFRLAGLPFVRTRILASVLPPTGNVLDRPQPGRAPF
ncbi:FAD-dependent oxidoreductase [Lentzea sp. NPDC102401]|uniref:FAD-dependent oxidoreductase n=1 Tax=Lentzea sp. NPDC102401 TaxID=3364128 RepID=UPI003807A169